MIYNMSYNRPKLFVPALEVISSEDVPAGMQGDDELSHKQKEGITVNCSQIAIIPAVWPPTHVLRDK